MANYVVGSLLHTKDGRKIGNAIIAGMKTGTDREQFYDVVTDFGNRVVFNLAELIELFHPPERVTTFTNWALDRLNKRETNGN